MPENPIPSPHWFDPIVEVYKKDIDISLIDENLKLTPSQRLQNLQSAVRGLTALRNAMDKSNAKRDQDQE